MEQGIKGAVLLLGEANFSFSLSLLNFCEPKFLTASCFESRDQAKKKYGPEVVESNVERLHKIGCRRVSFQVDATKISHKFPDEKFSRIIFMFPHVGGKSNLKKNRQLLDDFFASAKEALDSDGCVFVALAKGQGGTRFEEELEKRNNKDSWQILQIAHKNGFVLSDCAALDEAKFAHYKSTGFRSGQKSFRTKSGLVHRLQLGLPLPQYPLTSCTTDNRHFPFTVSNFFSKLKFLAQSNPSHPLNEFGDIFAQRLSNAQPFPVNQINDDLRYSLAINYNQNFLKGKTK